MKNIKTGDHFFFIDRCVDDVHKCEVELSQFDMSTKTWFYKVHDLTSFGSLMVKETDLFEMEEDARSALYREHHEMLLKYKEEIPDAQALIQFPLNHCICGEDCDSVARLAFTLRAEELGLMPNTDL